MKSILFTVVMAFSVQAFSWGFLGHQTSAHLAWTMLDEQTQNKVTALLNKKDIVKISTWADQARSEDGWQHTSTFHYEKVNDKVSYLDNLKSQKPHIQKKGGLIEALYIAEENLRSPSTSALDKESALKFLIHFIADIHQPLHTGRVKDNGGNNIPMNWLGFKMNLHQVWDSQILLLAHKDILSGVSQREQVIAYAEHLQTKFKDMEIKPALFSRYDEWMHESMVPRAEAYDLKNLSEEDYAAHFIDVSDERVYLAGLRIAHTINRILNEKPPEAIDPLSELRKQIVSIVGNFSEFVSLKPKY